MKKIETCSVILITKNEETNLSRVLGLLQDFQEIIVVDSDSTDLTQKIAERAGAKVFVHPFDNFAAQKNFALEKAKQNWVFSLDADEIPSEALIQSVREAVENKSQDKAGFRVRRRNIHFGRELKWGGVENDWPIRLFRKGSGRFEGAVHEALTVEGHIGKLKGEILHESNRTIGEYLQKLAQYTQLEAEVAKKTRIKTTLWHWGMKPFFRFLYTYFFRLGFLDGFEGFLFHSLSSFYLVAKEVRLSEELEHIQ